MLPGLLAQPQGPLLPVLEQRQLLSLVLGREWLDGFRDLLPSRRVGLASRLQIVEPSTLLYAKIPIQLLRLLALLLMDSLSDRLVSVDLPLLPPPLFVALAPRVFESHVVQPPSLIGLGPHLLQQVAQGGRCRRGRCRRGQRPPRFSNR